MNLKLRAALALGLMSLAGAAAAVPFAAVTSDNRLIYSDSASPQLTPLVVNITGLQAGETILGIDTRPANGQLFALGSTGRLYQIGNGFSGGAVGGAAQIGNGPGFTPTPGVTYGFDFNPTVDRIRIVGSDSSNLRYNPTVAAGVTPLAATDTTLTPATTAVGAAYDRNDNDAATATTLFLIDASGTLVLQGGVDGTPSPNLGAITPVGPLGVASGVNAGFDISSPAQGGLAAAAVTGGGSPALYTVNLTTGAATFAGNLPAGVTDITFVPAIPNQLNQQVIPTLSPVTLAALLGALGLLGLVVLRRKA